MSRGRSSAAGSCMRTHTLVLKSNLPLIVSCAIKKEVLCLGHAGQPDGSFEARRSQLRLLSALIAEPELAESAQPALASGPSGHPLGQQLASRMLSFLRSLADSTPLQLTAEATERQGDAAPNEITAPEKAQVVCFNFVLDIFQHMQEHAEAALAAGPAYLQALQALRRMLGRLQQQQQQQQQAAVASFAAQSANLLLCLTMSLQHLAMLSHTKALLGCDASTAEGQQPPRQQLKQRCLGLSLAVWQTTEAVPAISALMDALGSHDDSQLLRLTKNVFDSLGEPCFGGSCFPGLQTTTIYQQLSHRLMAGIHMFSLVPIHAAICFEELYQREFFPAGAGPRPCCCRPPLRLRCQAAAVSARP